MVWLMGGACPVQWLCIPQSAAVAAPRRSHHRQAHAHTHMHTRTHRMLPSGSWRCGSTHISPTSSDCGCRMRMPAAAAAWRRSCIHSASQQ